MEEYLEYNTQTKFLYRYEQSDKIFVSPEQIEIKIEKNTYIIRPAYIKLEYRHRLDPFYYLESKAYSGNSSIIGFLGYNNNSCVLAECGGGTNRSYTYNTFFYNKFGRREYYEPEIQRTLFFTPCSMNILNHQINVGNNIFTFTPLLQSSNTVDPVFNEKGETIREREFNVYVKEIDEKTNTFVTNYGTLIGNRDEFNFVISENKNEIINGFILEKVITHTGEQHLHKILHYKNYSDDEPINENCIIEEGTPKIYKSIKYTNILSLFNYLQSYNIDQFLQKFDFESNQILEYEYCLTPTIINRYLSYTDNLTDIVIESIINYYTYLQTKMNTDGHIAVKINKIKSLGEELKERLISYLLSILQQNELQNSRDIYDHIFRELKIPLSYIPQDIILYIKLKEIMYYRERLIELGIQIENILNLDKLKLIFINEVEKREKEEQRKVNLLEEIYKRQAYGLSKEFNLESTIEELEQELNRLQEIELNRLKEIEHKTRLLQKLNRINKYKQMNFSMETPIETLEQEINLLERKRKELTMLPLPETGKRKKQPQIQSRLQNENPTMRPKKSVSAAQYLEWQKQKKNNPSLTLEQYLANNENKYLKYKTKYLKLKELIKNMKL